MKLFTKSMEPNTTLGVAERVAYMSGNIGIALINTIVATFLMFFYTDVMMLNAGIIGTILMVSRLFDGVTDIIMGMIVDRTHSKYGKARVWVIRTCIPYAISGLLLVCVPGGMTELVQYMMDLKKVFANRRVYFVTFLRMLLVPLISLILIKISHMAYLSADAPKIMLIVFLAVITPSASTVTQMCQVYGNDSRYASAINVVTTLCAVVTMPVMVLLFEEFI